MRLPLLIGIALGLSTLSCAKMDDSASAPESAEATAASAPEFGENKRELKVTGAKAAMEEKSSTAGMAWADRGGDERGGDERGGDELAQGQSTPAAVAPVPSSGSTRAGQEGPFVDGNTGLGKSGGEGKSGYVGGQPALKDLSRKMKPAPRKAGKKSVFATGTLTDRGDAGLDGVPVENGAFDFQTTENGDFEQSGTERLRKQHEKIPMPVMVAKQEKERAVYGLGEQNNRRQRGPKKAQDVLTLSEVTVEPEPEPDTEEEEEDIPLLDTLASDQSEMDRTLKTDETKSKEDKGRFWNKNQDKDQDGEPDDDDGRYDGYREGLNGAYQSGRGKNGRGEDRWRDERRKEPVSFIPDQCYFENTYLGGNAAYLEQMRRLDGALLGQPHRLATAQHEAFDAPAKAGLSLSTTLDSRSFEGPGRVFMQIALKGSSRFGWRRPPLEIALVVDGPSLQNGNGPAVALIRTLLTGLSSRDSLGVVVAGQAPTRLAELSGIRALRNSLLPRLSEMQAPEVGGAERLAAAMSEAGAMLQQATIARSTVPGTQIVLVLSAGSDGLRIRAATSAAHALTVRGVVTSVLELGDAAGGAWWPVANAGHGNYHRIAGSDDASVAAAVKAELESLAKVVARLLRLNIKLAPGVKAVRVLGAQVLDQQEVRQVKAREEATDRHLSKSLGIESDRGEDNDGIQTVIPYFHGGDSHVVVVELWVEKAGAVADVSLKYKDMVTMQNATARTAASLRNVPRSATEAELAVRRNLRGFKVADALRAAALALDNGDNQTAAQLLAQALGGAQTTDRQLLAAFQRAIQSGTPAHLLVEALRIAARRKIGGTTPGA